MLGLRWLALRQHALRSRPPGDARRRCATGVRDPDLVAAATVLGNVLVFARLPALAAAAAVLEAARSRGRSAGSACSRSGFAYALLSRGVRGVRAFDATLLMLIEPVLNPVWAWLLHGETPGPWSLLGGLLIVGTTAARTCYNPRQ